MFELEADRFMNLNYSEHDFKTEAGAVKGEYTKNYASPYQKLYEMTVNTAFDQHTYKHTTMGFFDDIVDMPNQYEYSRKFFRALLPPRIRHDRGGGRCDTRAGQRPGQEVLRELEAGKTTPPRSRQNLRRRRPGSSTSRPVRSRRFCRSTTRDRRSQDTELDMPALDVMSTILFSQNSALFQKLVVQERKARFVGGGAFDSRDPNLFTIQASLISKDDMQYVKDEIVKAIDDLKANGVDQKRLDETKSNLKYGFAMRIDNPDAIANTLCHYIALTGDPETVNRVYQLYDKVTVDDLKRIAAKYFVPTGLTIATISADAEGGVK